MSSPTERTHDLAWMLVDRHVAAGRGAAEAIVEPRRSWSYVELEAASRRAAGALRRLGVAPGERVALLLRDSFDFASAFVGALRAGVLPTPLSELWRGQDLLAVIDNAAPQLLIVHPDLRPALDKVLHEVTEYRLQVMTTAEFDAAAAEAEPLLVDAAPAGGPVMLLYANQAALPGRGVPHEAAAVLASYRAWAEGILKLTPDDRMFATPRLASAYGIGAGLLFPLLAGATTCFLPDRTKPRAVFEAIATFRPTVFCAVPSLYRQMCDDLTRLGGASAFDGVRMAISGAEPLSPQLYARLREEMHLHLVHGFGATEAVHFVFAWPSGEPRLGSIGRLLPGFEARIVDERGRPVAAEEIGELVIRGPSLAKGYWRRPEETKRAFLADGWFRTGDRCFVDGGGFYFHCGRVDGQFKVSGRWVAPAEIERMLVSHPAVWECAVVGEEDAQGLMEPVAYVVCNVGQSPSEALGHELMNFVKAGLSPYKYPRRIQFVEELPKSSSGEVQRWRLGPWAM